MSTNGLQGTPIDLDGQHVDDDKVMLATLGPNGLQSWASTLPSKPTR